MRIIYGKSVANSTRHVTAKLAVMTCFVAALVIDVGGCQKSSGTELVSGRITYRGEPISSAAVNFYPVTGRAVPTAVSNGEYSAQLLPGEYVVVMSVGSEAPKGWKEGDPIPPPKVVLPPEYTERAKSTLKTTVKPGQSDAINFDLK